MKQFLFVFLFSVFAGLASNAQVFGGNPPTLKFYQLNTDTVRVLFPPSLEKEAREVAWLAHQLAKQAPASLGGRFRKFDVVLQNQTTVSNAYVGMAPYRSEFMMMPELSNITINALPWHHTLAIHEFRHVEQFSNFNKKLPRFLGWISGQQGKAVGMSMIIPDWFWEGDAVWQETVLTKQGRGRLPDFFNAYRSLWLDQKEYRYQKLRNGSLRHYVPNHYHLGYLLVSYGREQYGLEFWNNVIDDALACKGLLYPFQHAVKKHTGIRFSEFVKNAFAWFQQQMQIQNQSIYGTSTPVTKMSRNNTEFYQYPFLMQSDSLILLKTSYKQIPTWMLADTMGITGKLRVKDITYDDYYSYRNGKVVYTSWKPDARWGWKEYSEIRLLDVQTRRVQKITKSTRLFMPDLSPDLRQIIAVQHSVDQQNALCLIDIRSGNQRLLPNTQQYIYTYPKFDGDGTGIISAVRNTKGEMALLHTSIVTGIEKLLFPFINTPLAYVQVAGKQILFTASQPAGDQLFSFDLETSRFQKVSQLPNGTYQAVADASLETIFFNTFTSAGNRLIKSKAGIHSKSFADTLLPLADLYLSQQSFTGTNLLADVRGLPGPVTRYKGAAHLFNIHSWTPTLREPDYGITFLSDNVLNTFSGSYGYFYNRNEGFHQIRANLIYGGWYPVVNAGVEQTWHRSSFLNDNQRITWNQTNANVGVTVPLNLSGGRQYRRLTIASSLNTEFLQFTGESAKSQKDSYFNYFTTSVRWSSQSQKARMHIYPRFAHLVQLQYRRTVNGVQGHQLLAQAGIYLPGLFVNHNLVVLASYAVRDTFRGSWFVNNFPFARGYNALHFPRMKRLSVNYHFPILYPDFGMLQLLYVQRIRGNTFYDFTRVKSVRTDRQFDFRSAGMEVFFDTRIWNSVPLTVGVRYSRLLDTDFIDPNSKPNRFEIILPLDLF